MADIVIDGRTRVDIVPGEDGIADPAAPTLTELESGFRVSQWMPQDGLQGFQATTESVDAAGIESTHDDTLPGRYNHSGAALRIKKQAGDDDIAHDTLVYGFLGFAVVRRFINAAEPYAEGQQVSVYPIACGQVSYPPPERNSMGIYEVPVFMREEPHLRALVATA